MAGIRKINERWYLLFKDNAGKQRTQPLGKITKKQAEQEKARFELGQSRFAAGLVTFNSFAERYLKWHRYEYPDSHARVLQIVSQYLTPVFGAALMGEIKPEMAEEYKLSRAGKAAPGTIIKEVRTLKAIFNKAVEWGVLSKSPITHVKPPRDNKDAPPPFYTSEQLQALYKASNDVYPAVWQFAANTGLRRAELQALRKADLQAKGVYVVSRSDARTKSGKWRLVPWTDGARQAVDVLRAGVSGDWVVPKIAPGSLSRHFKVDAKRAGLEGSLHWLRHTYASHLVMSGFPLRAVQQVMGHSTVAVTERYAHLADDYLLDKMGGFSI